MKTWRLGYEKSKKKAKRIYSRIGKIKCPALSGDFVSFNSDGFNHLIRKGRIPRTRNEQKRRFVLIPYAEKVIKNPKAKILYSQRKQDRIIDKHGKKITVSSIAHFWAFVEKFDKQVIKVIVRQFGNGQKHFFSIMGTKKPNR